MRNISLLLLFAVSGIGWLPAKGFSATAEGGEGRVPDVLQLAIASDDAASRIAAIGFSSLVRLRQLEFSMDTVWARSSAGVLESLRSDGTDLAILNQKAVDPLALDGDENVRAVMKYWMVDAQGDEPEGQILVARASVSGERIEAFIDAALHDQVTLRAVRIDLARLTPEDALAELPFAPHDGVLSYLRSQGLEPPKAPAAVSLKTPLSVSKGNAELPRSKAIRPEVLGAIAALEQAKQSRPHRSFTLYFDTGDSAIDRDDFKSVAEACQFAATLPSARFVISGHADTVGSDAFNDILSSRRASAVADAIRNDPRFREALSVVEFGEQKLAVATGDGVDEPMNRRVEITVFAE